MNGVEERSLLVRGLIERRVDALGESDREFLRRVYEVPAETYAERISAIGFTGAQRVLDAGCGYGQWSLELARANEQLVAVDRDESRLRVLAEAFRRSSVGNVHLGQCRLEELPFPAGYFDLVFCYGVIFCTDWRRSLMELVRTLRAGGRLYLTANGLGWMLNLWLGQPHAAPDYDPRRTVVESLKNTLEYEDRAAPPLRGQVLIDPGALEERLGECGARVLGRGAEGSLHLEAGAPPPKAFFSGSYYGQLGVYELVAEKE